MKKNNIIRNYHNDTIISTIFSPVKSIAINHCLDISEKIILLREIIKILQDALII